MARRALTPITACTYGHARAARGRSLPRRQRRPRAGSSRAICRRGLRPLGSCCIRGALDGVADYIEDETGLGQHWDVAAVSFVDPCAHAFGDEALQVGMNCAVFGAYDVPARLRSPCRAFYLL